MGLGERFREFYTYEDYRGWKGDWELIEGVPYPVPPFSSIKHQVLVFRLVHLLREELLRAGCNGLFVHSEVEWLIRSDTVVRPGLLISEEELSDAPLTAPPLAVFEILCEGLYRRGEGLKFELYLREGVGYYGLVYPALRRFKIYDFRGEFPRLIFDGSSGPVRLTLKESCLLEFSVDQLFEEI